MSDRAIYKFAAWSIMALGAFIVSAPFLSAAPVSIAVVVTWILGCWVIVTGWILKTAGPCAKKDGEK